MVVGRGVRGVVVLGQAKELGLKAGRWMWLGLHVD